jgi:AraC-like DNA-binding protein
VTNNNIPALLGKDLFRENELVYINKSTELEEYTNVMHKHDFIEIVYVISGKGLHLVGDSKYEVSKGDLFVINYDVPHCFLPKEIGKEQPIVYNCTFMPEFLDSTLFTSIHFEDVTSSYLFKSLFPEDYMPYPDVKLRDTDFIEIGELFSKMYTEYKLMKKGYCDIIRAYIIELIVKIFRNIDIQEKKPNHKNIAVMEKAIEHMKNNYNQDISLSDLAMRTFFSKNYFSKLFKEVTGLNVSDYIQKIRVDEACGLLMNTNMKVVDIAFQVGFNDIKFFYEVFKRITGKTPGEYRSI